MTLRDAFGLSETRERYLVRGLQLGLCGIAVFGLATLRFGLAVNAGISLTVTFLPAALRREYGYVMDGGLVLLISLAVFLHAVGSLGLYVSYSWYDEVTHTVSAVLVAGVGYAVFVAFERHSDEIHLTPAVRGVFVLVFVLGVSVVWEVFEFGTVWLAGILGVKSPVRVFGIDDIVTDMIFNALGGIVVAVWGSDYFADLVPFIRQRLRS